MADSALIEELLRQYGENPRRVFARLANEYRKQGDLTTAIEICRTQVPLQPAYISGYIVLGQALFESGQHDEARATFEAAIALDPENLIALRQLGDIARLSGDIEGARGWYYRLLEVDPQNDDVAAHVRALERAPAEPQAPAREGEPVSWSDINPERSTTPPAPVIPPLPRVTLGTIPEDVTAALATLPTAAAPAAASPAGGAAPAPPAVEFAGLDEFKQFQKPIAPPHPQTPELIPDVAFFTRDAGAPGTASAPTTPAAAPAAPSPAAGPPAVKATPRRSEAVAPPPAPPPAPPVSMAPSSVPTEEAPALDTPVLRHPPMSPTPPGVAALRDTLVFKTPVASPVVQPRPAPPPAPTSPRMPTPVAPLPAAQKAPPTTPDRRAGVDMFGSRDLNPTAATVSPSHEEAYDPTVGRMLDLNVAQGGEIPAGFMTETMAELYLQQGYHDEALKIYRQLASQRPDDPSLRDRITRLEHGARSSVPIAASVSEDVISAAHGRASRTSPTIRNFFGGLAARRAPGLSPETAAPLAADAQPAPRVSRATPSAAAPAAAAAPAVPALPVAPAAPTAPPAAAASAAPAPARPLMPNGDVDAALDSLFRSGAGATDEAAATSLAGAFAPEYADGSTPPAGQPARAAQEPLSLDDVFRGQKAPAETRRAPQSVTFDEFFAPRESGATQAVQTSTPDRAAEGGSAAPEMDLALFHDWLDGLKK